MNKKISTRTAYGEALAEIGSDPRIFVLDADLQCCTRTEKFGALYPERSRNVGIAEANMVGIAAGMAACGKIVFVNSFAMFTAGRAFEQNSKLSCLSASECQGHRHPCRRQRR